MWYRQVAANANVSRFIYTSTRIRQGSHTHANTYANKYANMRHHSHTHITTPSYTNRSGNLSSYNNKAVRSGHQSQIQIYTDNTTTTTTATANDIVHTIIPRAGQIQRQNNHRKIIARSCSSSSSSNTTSKTKPKPTIASRLLRILPQKLAQQIEALLATPNSQSQKLDTYSLRRVFQFARPELPLIAVALGCQLVTTMATMTFPMAVGKIVDIIEHPELIDQLRFIGRGLFVVFGVGSVAVAIRVGAMNIVGERISRKLRNDLFNCILKRDMVFFDGRSSGELVNRLSSDTAAVSKMLTENLTRTVRSSVTSLFGLASLVYFSPKLSIMALAIIPSIAGLGLYIGRFVRTLSKQCTDALADATQVSSEKLSSIRTVKLLNAQDIEAERYSEKVTRAYDLFWKTALAEGAYLGGGYFITQVSLIGVLWYGSGLVMSQELTVGMLTSFTMYAVNLGFGVSNLATAYGQLTRAQGSAARVIELLDNTDHSTLEDYESGDVIKGPYEPTLRFENVEFAYHGRKSKPRLLTNLSFDVAPGEVVALAGASGSGKSTVMYLITRLYTPTQGKIYFAERDTATLNLKWLRSQFGVVPQEPVLFSGTIRENVMYGVDLGETTAEERAEDLARACKLSTVDEFAKDLPDGLDSVVGERGASLSGGQRQRIALARALYHRPRFLVMDELTSQLDSSNEAIVSHAIRDMAIKESLSVLIIAHRLSTLRTADRILFLHDGMIAEEGSFQELATKDGLFSRHVAAATRNMPPEASIPFY